MKIKGTRLQRNDLLERILHNRVKITVFCICKIPMDLNLCYSLGRDFYFYKRTIVLETLLFFIRSVALVETILGPLLVIASNLEGKCRCVSGI